MSRKHDLPPSAPGTEISGLVLIDKPAAWTSHDVVGKVRRLAGTRKVGHAGTLDPMATGLLVVGFNKATRLLTKITGTSKTYEATIRLGQTTTTDDADGEVVRTRLANAVQLDSIREHIKDLTGDIEQVPSSVSAVKVDGKRSYDRVRAGEEVKLAARPVHVGRFEVTGFRRAEDGKIVDLDVEVDCSSGTYIRALARDLGEALETGGHLISLRRLQVGPFDVANAVAVEQLAQKFSYTDLSTAAAGLFKVRALSADETRELSFGRRISASDTDQTVLGQSPQGEAVALLEDIEKNGQILAKPQIVFNAADQEKRS